MGTCWEHVGASRTDGAPAAMADRGQLPRAAHAAPPRVLSRAPPRLHSAMRELGVRSLAVTRELCQHEAILAADAWPDRSVGMAGDGGARAQEQGGEVQARPQAYGGPRQDGGGRL